MKNTNLLKEFISGKCDYKKLEKIGIVYNTKVNNEIVITENTNLSYIPSVKDLLKGFCQYLQNKNKLKIWATLILGITAYDFTKIEQDRNGEILLNALWNSSGGKNLSKNVFQLINEFEELSK